MSDREQNFIERRFLVTPTQFALRLGAAVLVVSAYINYCSQPVEPSPQDAEAEQIVEMITAIYGATDDTEQGE